MNKKLLISILIAAGIFSVYQFIQASITANNPLLLKFEQMHNVGMIKTPPTVAVVTGDSVYLKELEVKGTWRLPESGSAPLPYQAYQWFANPADDSPFKLLNWAGITFDTTWVKTIYGPDSVKFQVPNRSLKNVRSAASWTVTGGVVSGWLDTTATYYVDVYGVRTSGDTLIKAYTFEGFTGGVRNFPDGEFEVKFGVTGYANDSAATYPAYITAGETSMKIKFKNGPAGFAFPIISGMDSLRIVWRNSTLTFNSQTVGLALASQSETGLQVEAQVTNVPGSGYFSAGDTVNVNIVAKSDSGLVLDWQTQATQLGIQKVELVISGPRSNYNRIMGLQNIVNNYIIQTYPVAAWSGMPSGTAFTNPIKIVIPQDSLVKFGNGTYTAYMSIKRIFGSTFEKSLRLDFQVGTSTVDPWPLTSAIAGQSCASCHGVNGPTKHHASFGVEDCLPCHTDNMTQPLYKLYHIKHFKSTAYTADLGSCTPCHVNASENRFTRNADFVCQSCHVRVPYLSLAHQTAIPLYAESGMTCATMNCHAGGGLGVFKTISETHAGLQAKYQGGALVAQKIVTPIVIDGTPDPVWAMADSITSVSGITLKFFYDDSTLYTYAKWVDGHREYPTGQVAPSKSEFRRRWSYDGTNWTYSGEEDRLGITWKMTDNYGASCGRTCHNENNPHATSNTRMDVWHWKAQRTNPVVLLDDQYWDATGRKNDAVTSGLFGSDNITGTLPTSMGPDAASNLAPWLLQTTAIPFVNSGWVAGDKIPGYTLNDATVPPIVGSRGDVSAKAVFNQTTGVWTLEISRKLNTGNADDFIVDLVNGNDFTVAKFDAVGGQHARQGVDIGVYHLSYSPDIVPVELTSFRAEASNNKVTLSWQTASETNNRGFEIERKLSTDWESLGFIEGKGNTTQVTAYNFTDKVNLTGKYSYRLKQVDFDGTASYSKVVEVLVQPTEFSLSQNYPNPFNPSTTIDFTLAQKGQVAIKVYSLNGEEVFTIMNEEKEAGYYSVMFNASNLSSGVYFYRMVSGKFTMTKKFMVLK